MKPTIEEVRQAVAGLPEGLDAHVIDDAWYSERALTRALGTATAEELEGLPAVAVVRVDLPRGGCLELHPRDDGTVAVTCYCCFGGNPDRGVYPLGELRDAVAALKDHRCPPWPG